MKSIDLSTVRFMRASDQKKVTVLINFTLLSTACQSTPSVTHKNKPDHHHFEATTKENSHFTKTYCKMPVNQTWRCIEKLPIPLYKYDWHFTWSHILFWSLTFKKADESNQTGSKNDDKENTEDKELIWWGLQETVASWPVKLKTVKIPNCYL